MGSKFSRRDILKTSLRVTTALAAGSADNVLDIIDGYDVIVDGTDNFPTRYLLNDASLLKRIPVVHGSIFRFEGQVSVFKPYEGPCYRCLLPEPPPPELAPSCAEAGVLGVLALRHGDDFTTVYGDANGIRRLAPGRSDGAFEHALRTIDAAIDRSSAPSDRDALLSFITRTISRRMIVVIVTDEAGLVVEFQVNGANGTREAGECFLVEDAAPPRARRRHGARGR